MEKFTAKPERWYFTFGVGSRFRKHYVCLSGTVDETRADMFAHFGDKWCMQYREEDFQAIKDRWGFTEMVLPAAPGSEI